MVSKQRPHSSAFSILLESEDEEEEDEEEDEEELELDSSVDAFAFFLGGIVRSTWTLQRGFSNKGGGCPEVGAS
jgi:hypothetical protein